MGAPMEPHASELPSLTCSSPFLPAPAPCVSLRRDHPPLRTYAASSTFWKQKASNVVQFLLQHAPELWPGVDGAALRDLGQVATVLGQSRLWDSQHNEHSHKVGVPLADMLNHRTGANTVDELRACGALGLDGAPCRVLASPHAVAAGDELFDAYVSPLAYDGNTRLVTTCASLPALLASALVRPAPSTPLSCADLLRDARLPARPSPRPPLRSRTPRRVPRNGQCWHRARVARFPIPGDGGQRAAARRLPPCACGVL